MSFDVADAVAAIAATVVGISAIGAALLTPSIAKKGWALVRGALK